MDTTTLKVIRDENGLSVGVEITDFPIVVKNTDSGNWFAHSPQFKTFGKGTSQDDAVKELYKALDVFFEVHISQGTLESALSSLDFNPLKSLKPQITYSKSKVGNTPSVLAGLMSQPTNYKLVAG